MPEYSYNQLLEEERQEEVLDKLRDIYEHLSKHYKKRLEDSFVELDRLYGKYIEKSKNFEDSIIYFYVLQSYISTAEGYLEKQRKRKPYGKRRKSKRNKCRRRTIL